MTRALVLIWLVVVAVMPVTAHAMGSARDLADDCRTLVRAKTGAGKQIRIPFTKKALVCWGYMQAIQDLSVLADEDGRRMMGACAPERTTLLKLIQAFVSYARSRGRGSDHRRLRRGFLRFAPAHAAIHLDGRGAGHHGPGAEVSGLDLPVRSCMRAGPLFHAPTVVRGGDGADFGPRPASPPAA